MSPIDDSDLPENVKRPSPAPFTSKTVTPVFEICLAYESGFGHGYKADGAANPYKDGTEEREAYDIGYGEGAKRTPDETPAPHEHVLVRNPFSGICRCECGYSPEKSEAPKSDKCEHGIPRRFCTAAHDIEKQEPLT